MSTRDRGDPPLEVAMLLIFESDGSHKKKMVEVFDLHHALFVGAKNGVKDLDIKLEQSSDCDCVKPLTDVMGKHDWQVLDYGRAEIDKLLERWDTGDSDLEADLCFELAEGIIQWSKNVRCMRNPFDRNVRIIGWYSIYHEEECP